MKHWLNTQFRTFRKLHRWWRDQLTLAGKIMFVVMLCCLPTLADSSAVLAIVFIACSTTLLITGMVSYLYRPNLSVKVVSPRNWMRTEGRVVRVDVTNQTRHAVYDLQLELLPETDMWEIVQSHLLVGILPPGGTVSLVSTVKALRRGLCPLPRLRATSFFPLNLIQRAVVYAMPRQALILPFYRELRSFRLADSAPSLARGNNLALQTVGLTGEYVGSREYIPGVPVRKWDYPSWARLGQPVVREYSQPRHPSAAVVLDTYFPDEDRKPNALVPEFEAMLSLAAAITHALIVRGNRIDLLVIGQTQLKFHGRDSGEDQLAILEQLALAEPAPTDDLQQLRRQLERTPVSWDIGIVVSSRWQAAQENIYRTVTRRRVLGRRLVVQRDDQPPLRSTADIDRLTCSEIEAGLVEL